MTKIHQVNTVYFPYHSKGRYNYGQKLKFDMIKNMVNSFSWLEIKKFSYSFENIYLLWSFSLDIWDLIVKFKKLINFNT